MKSSIFNMERRNEISKISGREAGGRGAEDLFTRRKRGGVRARGYRGVSPFSMTKSPPGQAKPGVGNRKEKILISLSTKERFAPRPTE